MAGIGFELKKLFSKKGLLATTRAYGYASMVCAGPMILGFLLLLGVMYIAERAGASRHERELLVTMITHALLASLTVTSVFSMLIARYCADMIYENRYDRLIPSMYGSCGICLVLGGIGYGIFLWFCGVAVLYRLLSFVLFMALIVVWMEINYLTMLKDYKAIALAFFVSLLTGLILSVIFIWLFHIEIITAVLTALTIGYGIMSCWYFAIIYKYLPEGFGTSLRFMEWADKTPALAVTGLLITLGLFGHLVIFWWASPLSVQVEGLFYGAPAHDVPAIWAFFSILITTVGFVVFTETRFYPKYKEYFALFNGDGSIDDLDEAESSMFRVLAEELGYLALKQVFSALIFMIFGSIILPRLPLGFTNEMLRIFRVLCVGYAFYAIGNSTILVLQYFADMNGACFASVFFAICTNGFTLITTLLLKRYYGFGFLLGSLVFAVCGIVRLAWFLRRLKYNVLARQPLNEVIRIRLFGRIADFFEIRAVRVQRRRREKYLEKIGEMDFRANSATAKMLRAHGEILEKREKREVQHEK